MEDNQLKISEMPELKTPSLIDKELEPSFPVILKGLDGNYYNYATSTRLFAEYILNEIKNSGYVTLDKLMAKLNELNLGKYLTEADVKRLLDELGLEKYMTKTDLKFELEVVYLKLYTLLENYLGAPNYDIIKAYRTSDSYVNNFGTAYKNDENYPPQGWSLGLTQDATAGQYVWECQARKTNEGYYTWLDGSIWSTAVCIGKIGSGSAGVGTGSSPGTGSGDSDIPAYPGVVIQYVYKEADTKPETPGRLEGYYDFDTKTLTPPKGWSLTYSETSKTHIWYTSKMFYENTAFGDVEWTPVALLIRNAGDLLDSVENVISANTVVYAQGKNKPRKPVGGNYDFEKGELTECPRDPDNAILWKTSPDNYTETVWVSYNNFHSNGEQTGWSDPVKSVNLEAILEAAKARAESAASEAVSDATSHINKALDDLEKSGENFVAVVDSLDVLYEWLEHEAPGTGDEVIVESPIATLEELKTKSGSDYFKKFCKVGDKWYRYTATAGSLTTQLSSLKNEFDELKGEVETINTSVISQMSDEIRMQVSKGYTNSVTWTQVSELLMLAEITKLVRAEYSEETIINAFNNYKISGDLGSINTALNKYKIQIYKLNHTDLDALIAAYDNISLMKGKYGSYFITNDGCYYRADYPLSTSFMDMLADSLSLGVANTDGNKAIFELSIKNGVSNTLISSDQIVLDGDVLAKALYSNALTIIDEDDGKTPVTILNGDGSVMFGKNSVSFDKSGLGYVAEGLISWDHFKFDDNGEIVYNSLGEPIIDSEKPMNLHIKGIVNAYAGRIGGWTLAGDSSDLDAGCKKHTNLDQAYLYSSTKIDGAQTKLILSPLSIHCTVNDKDAYSLNRDGSARFANGFVRFEKDGSGGIHPGTGDYEKNAENGLTWNANGNVVLGANVKLKWNNKDTTLGNALSDAASSGGEGGGMTSGDVMNMLTTQIDWNSIITNNVTAFKGSFIGDVTASSFKIVPDLSKPENIVVEMTYFNKDLKLANNLDLSKEGIVEGTPILIVKDPSNGKLWIINMLLLGAGSSYMVDIIHNTVKDTAGTMSLESALVNTNNSVNIYYNSTKKKYYYGSTAAQVEAIPAGKTYYFLEKSYGRTVYMAVYNSSLGVVYLVLGTNGKLIPLYKSVTCTECVVHKVTESTIESNTIWVSENGYPVIRNYGSSNVLSISMEGGVRVISKDKVSRSPEYGDTCYIVNDVLLDTSASYYPTLVSNSNGMIFIPGSNIANLSLANSNLNTYMGVLYNTQQFFS